MKDKWYKWMLIGVFLLVFTLRILIALQTNEFSDDSSYFALRQVESITSTGKPIIYDELSYGGRTLLFSPLFYYLLAALYFIIPKILTLKIAVNLLASTLVFASFLIGFEMTKSRRIALLTAFLSGFIPIYFQETVNSLSIFSLTMPLTFFSIYYFMKLNKEKKYYTNFLVLLSILIISSPTSIIFVLGILFFLILAKLEKIEINKSNTEILIVSIFFYLWLHFLLYKKALLFHGPSIIWQNIPKIHLFQYFSEITILQTVYLIGVLPFVLGTYSAYIYVTREKAPNVYVIIGASSSLFLLLWFKLIPFKTGLVFLGGFLVLLLAQYLKLFFDYLHHTKFLRYENLITLGFVILILASSLTPSLVYANRKMLASTDKADLQAYKWLTINAKETETVLASAKEGHALAYLGNVKTVIDDNYLLVKNIDQRVYDVERLYTTRFSQEAVGIASKYNIDYVLIDDLARDEYNITGLFYADQDCFLKLYDNHGVQIYSVVCEAGIE